ncbi:MAG TPA: glycosyltransferase [Chloroflexi bacterium]|nr:glycosyltransferase [Chloroflexota bacterium]
MNQPRVLIITHDVVGENMAGPAIRCWEFARVLSHEAIVTLATPYPTSLAPQAFEVVQYEPPKLEAWASQSDVVVLSGATLWRFPALRDLSAPLVVDIYDPFLLESLPMLTGLPSTERRRRHAETLDALTDLLTWGDFFICSSEKQRDYWLGWLNALGRINPLTYDDDPTLLRLIDVVAFGLPHTPPEHTHSVLKGVWPGIQPEDHVVVWGGGVYNWFDPLTLIRAMECVSKQRDDVKLFFLGIGHPNPDVHSGEMAEKAIALSQELGLYEQCVFFNDWTPYEERQNYLLEADVGISLHFAHVETHFSFRTRLLDYIWTALPIIVTRGDVLSSMVKQKHLGWVVDYESVEDVTTAILESVAVSRGDFRERFATVAPQLKWDTVMRPLVEFCRTPWCAPDRALARSDLQSLPTLKLVSQINALRREVDRRDERASRLEGALREREGRIADFERKMLTRDTQIAHLENQVRAKDDEVEHLREILAQIRQGRMMRLLDGINHIIKGGSLN